MINPLLVLLLSGILWNLYEIRVALGKIDWDSRGILSKTTRIVRLLEKILTPVGDLRVKFFDRLKGKVITMANLKVSQKLPLSISIVDAGGNPALVDGLPIWSVLDPAKGSLAVSPDGLSAEFQPLGPLGDTEIQVKADADLGAGVREILGSLPVSIAAGDAVSIQIAAGSPIDP